MRIYSNVLIERDLLTFELIKVAFFINTYCHICSMLQIFITNTCAGPSMLPHTADRKENLTAHLQQLPSTT